MNEASQPSTARRKISFLFGFALYFAALWLLWETPVIYPLKIFVVLLHEISHGIASVATGGVIEKIVLDPQQGGACHCGGGNAFVTLTAGYLGSLLWGVALLSGGERPARLQPAPGFLDGRYGGTAHGPVHQEQLRTCFRTCFRCRAAGCRTQAGPGREQDPSYCSGADQLPVRHLGYQERRARPAPPADRTPPCWRS